MSGRRGLEGKLGLGSLAYLTPTSKKHGEGHAEDCGQASHRGSLTGIAENEESGWRGGIYLVEGDPVW